MKKINLAITGCLGRMGQQIIKSAKKDKNFKLVAITESKRRNKKINGVKIDVNNEQTFKNAHLIIDFTVPKCTFQILKIAAKSKKKSGNWNYWIHKKRRKFNKKIFKKNPNFKSRKYEFRYKPFNVSNRDYI